MPFTLRITAVGSAARSVQTTYALTAADFTNAQLEAADILARFQAVSAAIVSKTNLSWETEYPVTLPTNVDVAIVATMSGKINGTQKPVVVRFPAPKDSIRLGTEGDEYNELDLSDADVLAYWGTFGVGGEATISDGESVSATPRRSQIVAKASRNP